MQRKTFAHSLLLLSLVACNDAADDWPTTTGPTILNERPDAGMSEPTLPEQPKTFRIELSGTGCFGDCPTYSTSIDQDGNVVFVGERCVGRPGVFEQKVSASDARAVYDALRATEYGALGDRYVSEADGCEVWSDSPTYDWHVQADTREKTLSRYAGCEGIAALDMIDAIMPLLQERANVLGFLKGNTFNCDYQEAKLSAVNLRLSHAGTPIGMLKIEAPNSWSGKFELSDCMGAPSAKGMVHTQHGAWTLIDEERTPITLPGMLGKAGSLVIDMTSPATFNGDASIRGVRALRAEEDVALDYKVASACSD
jgi:hypothetical protein